jgi:broad specificity phosphatase PhoE
LKTTIILVRHGQTEWNRVERFRGRADVPLNQTGLDQATATGKRIAAGWMPVAFYSSPLARAVRTAEAAARHFDLPVIVYQGLVDIDYGQWQGMTTEQARQEWPEAVTAWYESPHLARIPGGESLEQIRERAMAAVAELAGRHPGQTIVLVGHTVINRIILLDVLGLGNDRFWHLRQDNCAINVFEASDGDYVLVFLNDTCHLQDLPG